MPRVSRLAFITVVSAACTQHRNNETIFSYLRIRERNFNRCSGSSVGSKKKKKRCFSRYSSSKYPSPSLCLKHFKMQSLHRLSLPTRRLKLTRKLFVVRNDVSNKSCTVSEWTHSAVICSSSSYCFSVIVHSLQFHCIILF